MVGLVSPRAVLHAWAASGLVLARQLCLAASSVALSLAAFVMVTTAWAAQDRHRDAVAVVIGNTNYTRANVNVDYAINDAKAIRQFLVDRLGFRENNVFMVTDAKKSDMERLFGTERRPGGKLLASVIPGKSDVFVFYAGHGAPDIEYKEPYLIPVDTDPDQAWQGYSLDLLHKSLKRVRKRIGPERDLVAMIDACFSGQTPAGSVLKISSAINDFKLPEIEPEIIYLRASAKDQVANWDAERKHSLFTATFLQAVDGAADDSEFGRKDGRVSWRELNSYLASQVPIRARRLVGREQTPEVRPDADIDWSFDVREGRRAREQRLCEIEMQRVTSLQTASLTTLRNAQSTFKCEPSQSELARLIIARERQEEYDRKQREILKQGQQQLALLRQEREQMMRERERERERLLARERELDKRRRDLLNARPVAPAPSSPSVQFQMLPNVDIVGRGLDIEELRNVSVEDCENRCAAISHCAQFNYDARNNWCWLKRAGGRRKYDPRGFSKVKVSGGNRIAAVAPVARSQPSPQLATKWNADYYGGDYNNLRKVSAEHCRGACASDARCRAFTWVPNKGRWRGTGRCWLKSSVGAESYKAGTFAGRKY